MLNTPNYTWWAVKLANSLIGRIGHRKCNLVVGWVQTPAAALTAAAPAAPATPATPAPKNGGAAPPVPGQVYVPRR